jgi:Zn-ribbon RNA-binding protein
MRMDAVKRKLFKRRLNPCFPWRMINMEKQLICSSCKVRITNQHGTARFPCPKCGNTETIRCKSCREKAVKYKCPECGFSGPN